MLMHKVEDPKVLTPEVKAWSEQQKKAGKIKFFGFGAHLYLGPLMMAAAKAGGWLDAVLMTYNYRTMNNDDIKRGMEAMDKAGVGFIAMKSQAERWSGDPVMVKTEGPEGTIETEDLSAMQHFLDKGYTPQQAKMKIVWEDQRVSATLSHITNLTILKANLAAATDGKSLSARDRSVLFQHAANTCNFYCQACRRCESVLPAENRIPDVLRYMMYYNSYGQRDQARELFRALPQTVRSALVQNDYSAAERVCPNGVRIGKAMREAVRLLG
jgi:predicted aldo/keto reductase-like oxidoreductase